MTLDPTKLMEMGPEEVTKTILHEIAHKKEVHELGGIVPEDVTELGIPDKGIFSLGEGKVAETDPSIAEHTWENMRARGAVSPIESQVVTAQESLFNNPDILEQAALFEQNLSKLRGDKLGDPYAAPPEFDPKTSSTPEKLKQLELDGKLESEFN